MKAIIISAAFLLTFGSFFQESFLVTVENKSGKNLDSVILMANSYKIKLTNIKAGEIVETEVMADSADVKHHILLLPYFHFEDSSFAGEYYYNDLGVIEDHYKVTIDSALKAKWEVSKD